MLNSSTLPILREGKNLLAFSGGVDSTALFFLLHQAGIDFDLAIVDYQMRDQSVEEVAYAHALAAEFHKECHTLKALLSEQNFEATARNIRYDFFESLIGKHGYTNLITAHQLDDRLEWLLMQLGKGAGLYELLGMSVIEKRKSYRLVRPLLETTRVEIQRYLKENSIRYFEDASNRDEKYKRNFFRHNLAAPLLEKYAKGIKKSFSYLDEDLAEQIEQNIDVKHVQGLYYFDRPASRRSSVIAIDRLLKALGFLMRQGDKEILKNADEHVVGRRYVVSFHPDYCFVAPYLTDEMPKAFKEKCRLLNVPQKLRPYLYTDTELFEHVEAMLSDQ